MIDEADARLEAYNRADRDEAEELYGDYVDAVETGTEILADMRDHYAADARRPGRLPRASSTGPSSGACRRSRSRSRIARWPSGSRTTPSSATCRPPRWSAATARSTGCCFPRFDSGSCFGALLGTREHGRWLIAPIERRPGDRAPLPPRHADPRERVADRRRPRPRDRLHAAARRRSRHRAHRRRARGQRRDDDRARHPLRLRLGRPVGAPARRRHAGRDRRARRARPAHAGRARAGRHDARRRVHRATQASACRSS